MLLPTCALSISTSDLLYHQVGKTKPPPPLDRTGGEAVPGSSPSRTDPKLESYSSCCRGGEHVSTHTHPSPDAHHPTGAAWDNPGWPESQQSGPKEPPSEEASLRSKKGKLFSQRQHLLQTLKEPEHEAESSSSCSLPLLFD